MDNRTEETQTYPPTREGMTRCPECSGPAFASLDEEAIGETMPRFVDCQDFDGCGFQAVLY